MRSTDADMAPSGARDPSRRRCTHVLFVALVLALASLPGCDQRNELPSRIDRTDNYTSRHHGIFARSTERQLAALTIARDAIDRGNTDLAKRQLRELSTSSEASLARANGIILLADLLSREGQGLEANNLLVDLRNTSPPWAPLHYAIGLNALRAGRDRVALEAFTNALRADPTALRVYPGLAALHEEFGDDDAADEVMVRYERAIYLLADHLRDVRSEEERISIIETLGGSPRDPRISRVLMTHAQSDSWRTQVAALTALRSTGTSGAVQPLRALSRSSDNDRVRSLALEVADEIDGR